MVKAVELKYVPQDILEEKEIPVLEAKPVLIGYIIKPIILLAIGLVLSVTPLGPLIVIAAIAWLIYSYLKWRGVVYVITNKRVIVKRGLLGIDYEDASLNKINNVFLRQGILGRIFGYGTVAITTSGMAGIPFLKFENVRNPRRVLRILKKLAS